MDWIKKNPAKFALLAVSLLTLVAAFFLYQNVTSIDSSFEAMRAVPPPRGKVEKLSTEAIDAAQKALTTPVMWQPKDGSGSLLVSPLYVLMDGKLVKLGLKGQSFNPPISNDWLQKYGLDVLNKAVPDEDPDSDGFSTRLEWDGMDALSHLDMSGSGAPVAGADGQPLPDDATDPTDPKSHPPYHTRLQLAKVVNIPFLLKFMTADVNPKDPKDVTVAINTISVGNRTKFVKVGEDIPGTKFKTESYQPKEIPGQDGTKKDVSELTIINKETGAKVILIKGVVVDSPDSYAVFRYLWVAPVGQPTPDIPKRRGDTFSFPPETDKIYKVIDIKADEAVVEMPGGEKRTFKLIP